MLTRNLCQFIGLHINFIICNEMGQVCEFFRLLIKKNAKIEKAKPIKIRIASFMLVGKLRLHEDWELM